MSVTQSVIQIHPSDNVWIALEDVKKDSQIQLDGSQIIAQDDIFRGHKIATKEILKDQNIMKYGFPIGRATCDINVGDFVHSHNVRTNLEGELDYTYESYVPDSPLVQKNDVPTFLGYKRENGDVGVRNEIWLINTVGCINKVAENLARIGNNVLKANNFDGVQYFAHPYGCSQLGDDLEQTQKILANLIHHPNAGGVVVLGLGCENNYIDLFKDVIGDYNPSRVKFMSVQQEDDEMEKGLELMTEVFEYATSFNRVEVPVSALRIGLKCGGSTDYQALPRIHFLAHFRIVL